MANGICEAVCRARLRLLLHRLSPDAGKARSRRHADDRADEPMNKDRVNVVRGMLGLPPATDDELRNGIEGATDDMVKAVTFVRSRSHFYNVDIHRIALGGGFSAAPSSLAAFIERVPVKAVVSVSGRISEAASKTGMTGAADEPAVLMFHGDRDLPVIAEGRAPTKAHMEKVG